MNPRDASLLNAAAILLGPCPASTDPQFEQDARKAVQRAMRVMELAEFATSELPMMSAASFLVKIDAEYASRIEPEAARNGGSL